MSVLGFKSATELARMVRAREVGCLELLDYFIGRMEKYNPSVNAIIVQDLDVARKRAIAADKALSPDGDVGPLFGVPMTIKESFNLAGTPTTWGFPEFKNNIATSNAVAVDRLLDAGAVIFGKTNVPPGLMVRATTRSMGAPITLGTSRARPGALRVARPRLWRQA